MLLRTLRLLTIACAAIFFACTADSARDRARDSTPTCQKKCGGDCCKATEACDTETTTCVACEPKTCDQLGKTCGTVDDGCGGKLSCGTCQDPETCGGGGTPNVCGSGACTAKTCQEFGKNCGTVADGCGGTLNCGSCPEGERCGGGGGANVCGSAECTPETDRQFCERLGKNCGPLSDFDNCDSSRTVASCGNCSGLQTCGGGGSANVCGCTGETMQQLCTSSGLECGSAMITDSCGVNRTVTCGSCTAPETCGAVTPNMCDCVRESTQSFCARLGKSCGTIGDIDNCRLARLENCGTCGTNSVCRPNNTCECNDTSSQICSRNGKTCGTYTGSDLCGNSLSVNCGTCNPLDQCVNNVCVCAESDQDFCARLGKNCGTVNGTDRCGVSRSVYCGGCGAGSCGTAGRDNMCGTFVNASPISVINFAAIWGSGPNNVWGVGGGGGFERFDGASWDLELRGTNLHVANHTAIFGTSASNAWVGSVDGRKFFWNGTTWTESNDSASGIYDIWASSSTDYWAVGYGSKTYRNTGSGWTVVNTRLTGEGEPKAIWGFGSSDIFAATTKGVVKWDSAQQVWKTYASSPSVDFRELWGTSAFDLWAVGASGAIYHYDGSWTKHTVPAAAATKTLLSIWGSGSNEIYVGGEGGTLLGFDGVQWKAVVIPAQSGSPPTWADYKGIWGAGTAGNVWFLGANGTILRLSR